MRASKKSDTLKRQRPKSDAVHISGAEGIYAAREIERAAKEYISRALRHSRGVPDTIVLTIEEITKAPIRIPLLPLRTLECATPEKAKDIISELLRELGISKRAVATGLRILYSSPSMRGAAIVTAKKGKHCEPDHSRGVRASRFGLERASETRLAKRLAGHGINTATVKEALTLASKVVAHPDIVAELCVSDNPDYTTGYIAAKTLGYLRIPHIKHRGDMAGGRIFFVKEAASLKRLTAYLEKEPVLLFLP